MNRHRRIMYSLAVALVATGCVVPTEQRQAHFDRTWPSTTIRRVEIHEVMGTIVVDAGEADRVQLSADVRARVAPQKGKENDGYFTTEVVGDTLVIDSQRSHRRIVIGFWNNDDVRVDYHLKVPSNVALDLTTVNGRIETRAIAGEISAHTVNGEVDVEATGANEVTAKAVNGRIAARFLSDFHGADFKTVNGRVIASLPANASFLGDFAQVNGDFEAAFPLNIHSNPGSRRVSGEVNGGRYSLRIKTINGDIKVDNETPPPAPPPVPAAPPAPPTPRT